MSQETSFVFLRSLIGLRAYFFLIESQLFGRLTNDLLDSIKVFKRGSSEGICSKRVLR